MFSKLPAAIASASVLSVQARTVKQKHAAAPKKWTQEIDDEWTSHPNFPTGPYNQGVHEEAQTSQPNKHVAKKPAAAKKHMKKAHPKRKPHAQFSKENHVHFAQR